MSRDDRRSDQPTDAANERTRQAVKLLVDEVRERIDRHPLGHLLSGRGERIDLRITVPTALRDGQLERFGREADEAVRVAVQDLLHHSSVFQPGRVFCLRCRTAACEHAAPVDSRQAFAGWGSTGLPRFLDLGQWLLQRRDPRVDLLYQGTPRLIATLVPESELIGGLLEPFREGTEGFRLHAQVAAGWFRAPDPNGPAGHRQPLAVSFQVISSRPKRQRRRFGLNVVGVGPGGEPLENVYDRIGEIPWNDAVRWAQAALASVEATLERSPATPPAAVAQRITGIVEGLARRLEKGWRGKERRTLHGQQRHAEGDRPTRMALTDLARATPEQLLFDTRRGTLVVAGDRGRTHVFNLEGKLVTSVRYKPEAVERRRERERWRPATAEEARAVREKVTAFEDDRDDGGGGASGSSISSG